MSPDRRETDGARVPDYTSPMSAIRRTSYDNGLLLVETPK